MQFKFTSALGLLAAITPALADVSALQQLTEANINVRDIFDKVQPVSMIQDIPKGINEYKERILDLKQKSIEHFPDVFTQDQPTMCEEYANFATKAEDLMNALITKEGFIGLTPYSQPIADILLTDQEMTRTLAYNVNNATPDCKGKMAHVLDRMSNAYDKAVEAYSK